MTQTTRTTSHRFSFERLIQPGAHWVWLSIAMYVVACFLPAMPPIFGTSKIYGWQCVTSLIYVIPAWWANPTYYLAIILHWRRRQRAAAILAAIAALLAFSFQLMDVPNHGWAVVDQEMGCYVWIISLQILACNLVWQEYLLWRERQEIGPDTESPANEVAPITSTPRSSSPPPLEPSIGRFPE
jgi:hypothetical protein